MIIESINKLINLYISTQMADIQFARFVSLDAVRNTGVVETNFGSREYYNKCFFIAVYDALLEKGFEVSLVQIIGQAGMFNHQMIDTDNQHHQHIIADLAKKTNTTIDFYVGQQRNSDWYTTPDPETSIGHGSIKIRLLNKGVHFEHLTRLENGFVENVTDMDQQRTLFDQYQMMRNAEVERKRKEEAASLALARQLEQEERDLAEQIDRDHQFALQFQD